MSPLASLIAVAVVGVASLTACGGGDYCGKLQDYDQDAGLRQVNFRTQQGLEQVYDIFVDLQASAPADLQDEYTTVVDGVQASVEGRDDEIDRAAVQASYATISEHARDSCDVDMG